MIKLDQVVSHIDPVKIDNSSLFDFSAMESPLNAGEYANQLEQIFTDLRVQISPDNSALNLQLPNESTVGRIPIEEIPVFMFGLNASMIEQEVPNLIANNNYPEAFSRINGVFFNAGQIASLTPKFMNQVGSTVSSLLQKIPFRNIARALGADSYSITLGPTISLTLNFPV